MSGDVINSFVRSASGKYIKSTTIIYHGRNYSYALGINFDFTNLKDVIDILNNLTRTKSNLSDDVQKERNEYSTSISKIFTSCIEQLGIPANMLNYQGRLQLVALLERQ